MFNIEDDMKEVRCLCVEYVDNKYGPAASDAHVFIPLDLIEKIGGKFKVHRAFEQQTKLKSHQIFNYNPNEIQIVVNGVAVRSEDKDGNILWDGSLSRNGFR